ncbi:MAG: TolC family protein [Prevotella sp.]|jgi:outer membrane protein TolC
MANHTILHFAKSIFHSSSWLVAALPLLFCQSVSAQISLEECKSMARENYPAIKQYGLIERSRDYNLSNVAKGWLPSVSVSAVGAGFTDVLDANKLPAAASLDMDNYLVNGSLTVNQKIYDGGRTANQKKMLSQQAEVDKRQLDVTMYDINARVEQLYFGVLLLDEQIRQNLLLQEDLGISRKTVESMMKGGIANQSDLDAVSVEQVKAQQNEGSLRTSRKSYLTMLGTFIGKELPDNTDLKRPLDSDETMIGERKRPELHYFDAQLKLLDLQKEKLNANLRPTLSAFGFGAIHNRLIDNIHPGMLAGGLTLSWNIGALYTRKNDLHQIDVQREQIEANRETFLFNNRLDKENTNGQIENLKKLIAQDDEIVRLRQSIRSKSEKKVQLGTETVNEMLRDINAVSEASQQKAIHEVQLLQERYRLLHELGAN